MMDMQPAGIGVFISALLMQPLQFVIPTYLLARRQPRRDCFAGRLAASLTLLVLLNFAVSVLVMVGMGGSLPVWARYTLNFLAYSLYLVALVPLVLLCFDTSIWNALFCASAGYTIQNLGSGLGELVRILSQFVMGRDGSVLSTTLISNTTIALTTLIYYLTFIRRVDRIGRLGEDSRNMLGMLVLVIMGVIAFDVLVRGLEREGAGLGFMVGLRFVHFTVSSFILFAEYEMLYNVRLKADNVAHERLSAERERQYVLSRETIAAVNRRIHDIRHKVACVLAAPEAGIDQETLKRVVRDIAIFDTDVRTGNDVLDTILTEKNLACAHHGITLSCIADGTALAYVSSADLYAFFSALLDDVIDAVCALDDKRQRSVSLTIRRVGDLALLHVEHYIDEGQRDLPPQATEIISRYDGTITVSMDGGTCSVDVMLPVV